jgi:sugar O-acyltransferase (sialic acid O-acetyltransferase NeuD family)
LSLDKNTDTAWRVEGFIDDTPHLCGKLVNGVPVLGGFDYLKNYSGNIAVCIVSDSTVKRNLVSRIRRNDSINFPVVISANSVVSPYIEWGEGCIVALAHNFISTNIKCGNFVFINCGTRIGHDVIIGDYSTIFSGIDISGGVSIGSDCVIGSGVTVLPNVRIGNGSVIGGGSLVSKDIPPRVVAAGVPAKIMREIE